MITGELRHCGRPPEGWWCSRDEGHDGPCAARPTDDWFATWKRDLYRIAAERNRTPMWQPFKRHAATRRLDNHLAAGMSAVLARNYP